MAMHDPATLPRRMWRGILVAAVLGAVSVYVLGDYPEIIARAHRFDPIIKYHPDLVFAVAGCVLALFCVERFVVWLCDIKAAQTWRYLRWLLIGVTLISIVGARLVHNDIKSTLVGAGYVRCGGFYRQGHEDGQRHLFKSFAWVINAADCAKAGARPPPFDWRVPPEARYDSIQ